MTDLAPPDISESGMPDPTAATISAASKFLTQKCEEAKSVRRQKPTAERNVAAGGKIFCRIPKPILDRLNFCLVEVYFSDSTGFSEVRNPNKK